MKIISTKDKNSLTVEFAGELDHHAARSAIVRIGEIIDFELPQKTVLKLSSLTFMDSSGIAVIINIYRRMQELDGEFEISSVPAQALKVINAAGLNKIIKINTENTVKS